MRSLPYESLVLDGEVVVLAEDGRPDFGRLARRARLSRESDILPAAFAHPATYFVFDLLELNGHDLRGLPLAERKRYLAQVVDQRGPVRIADHLDRQGAEMFAQVQNMGLEGVMAKKSDAVYRAGRSDHWLKVRADRTATFVVVGRALGKGSRGDFGALLLGIQTAEGLVYVGRVGTGFREREIEQILEMLAPFEVGAEDVSIELPERKSARYANLPKPAETVWVEPEICCEVRFKEVTSEGLLRHLVFERLAPDVRSRDCDVDQAALLHAVVLHPPEPAPVPALAVGGAAVTVITRPQKVFWPEQGYSKDDLIDYYRAVAPWILPYLAGRPLVLDRYPDGNEGKSFFQKHAPQFTPEWVKTATPTTSWSTTSRV